MLNALRRGSTSIRCRVLSQASSLRGSEGSLIKIASIYQTSPTRAVILPLITSRAFSRASQIHQNAVAAREQEADYDGEHSQEATAAPATKFKELADRGLVDPGVIRTLTGKMKLETMTEVQSLTINEALKGKDVLAQAKTGTGKTIGFLLPVLQNIIKEDPSLGSGVRRAPRPGRFGERASDIRALIISPTRELAEQIANEARKLTQDTNVVIQAAVGGTQKGMHMRQMQQEGCHILVGTPGRLKDILSDRSKGVEAPRLSALVLDEADRLLDQGFLPEIQSIIDLLPKPEERDRQTLMYSATVSNEIVDLVRSIMKPDLHYIRTVQENEQQTHERVPQRMVTVSGFEGLFPTLLELCQREVDMADDPSSGRRPFKAIVYLSATVEARLASTIFSNLRRGNLGAGGQQSRQYFNNTRVYEIHSRLTQFQRTAAADYFRNSKSGILMSSDVTSRGMDFPGVTHVIQVGLPKDSDSYVHRLGRTARAGQEGEGWLIIPSAQMRETQRRLGEFPLERDETLSTPRVDYAKPEGQEFVDASPEAQAIYQDVAAAASKASPEDLESMYLAMLGVYQWVKDKDWMIESLNRMAKVQWGLQQPPHIARGLATKLGLTHVRALQGGFGRSFGDEFESGGRSGGGGRGGYGGDRSSSGGGRGGYGDRSGGGGGGFGRSDRGGGGGGFNRQDRGSGGGGFERRAGFNREDRGGGGFERRGGSDRSERGAGLGPRSGFGGDRRSNDRSGGERRAPRY